MPPPDAPRASEDHADRDGFQVDQPIFPWIVTHTVWVLNRRSGEGPLTGLADFGERVFFTAHSKHFTAKADPSLNPGFWVGRDPDCGEHLVSTTRDVSKARTTKRIQPAERLSSDLLEVTRAVS